MQDHYRIGIKALRKPLYFQEKGKYGNLNIEIGQESNIRMQPLAMFKQA